MSDHRDLHRGLLQDPQPTIRPGRDRTSYRFVAKAHACGSTPCILRRLCPAAHGSHDLGYKPVSASSQAAHVRKTSRMEEHCSMYHGCIT
jgi:hypothetical protein